jgi:hypothetical protein
VGLDELDHLVIGNRASPGVLDLVAHRPKPRTPPARCSSRDLAAASGAPASSSGAPEPAIGVASF